MLNKCIPALLLICFLLFTLILPVKAQDSPEIQTSVNILPAENTTSPRFNIMYGHRISPRSIASIGTGFTFYNDPLSLIPIFVDIKYDLAPAPSLFFIGLKAGYNISVLTDTDIQVDDHDGGFILNPVIGLNAPTKHGFSFTLSVGYSIEKASFSREDSWRNRTIETDITYKRLMAGFGLSF